MFLSSLNIDVQIHQEEVKKPSHSSVVLVPLKSKSTAVQQLVLTITHLEDKVSAKLIDDTAQLVFREWQSVFPLYPVQRAFADILSGDSIEIYITFDATNIFSNTQIRNIKKTISELFETELKKVVNSAKKEVEPVVEQMYEANLSSYSDPSKRRADLDLRERFSNLQQENSELQSALQQSKMDELTQKESIDELRSEIEKQQRSLTGVAERSNYQKPEITEAYQKIQKGLEDTNFKLRQAQQELLDKQREIQRLQSVVVENERYINTLQSDYDQLRESSQFQLEKTLEENDQLKSELTEYKNEELNNKKTVQLMKSEMRQVISDTENMQEDLKQKLQRMQYENEELRTIIKENQEFEDRTHQELLEATRQLTDVKDIVNRLETENGLLTQEWELRYQTLVGEKEEISAAYKTSRELEMARNNELIELKTNLITLEQQLQQAELDKKQVDTDWQTRLMTEEREKERLVQQVVLDKDQFIRNKEQEVKRLSDRLAQQKQLVDKLMENQSDTQVAWQENHEALEVNYQQALEKTAKLEVEILSLVEKNKSLEIQLEALERVEPIVAIKTTDEVELDMIQQEIDQEVAELTATSEALEEISSLEADDDYYAYDEEDSDYEYDYDEEDSDYEYGYDDDDYDYHEVDDLVEYHPESIKEDIEELLDSKDDDGKEKISKKDYAIYELYINNLKDLVEQADEEEFKEFVEPKMKKFKKFKKEFEEDVKAPTLFSRKYKLTTGLANEMKAYVLMSRHLSVLLDVEVLESDYDYDYDSDYDYEYDYDYDYDYDSDYDYE